MENRKLVKEIITTETEKFTEEGKIKERVKETREKIYSNNFSKKQLEKAEIAKEKSKEVIEEKVEEKPKDASIAEIAEAIDKRQKEKVVEEAAANPAPQFQPQAPAVAPNPYDEFLKQQQQLASAQAAPKFPWEKQ